MIAVKREVAAELPQVFRGANVWSALHEPFGERLANLTTSHCTDKCLQGSCAA